MATVDEVRALLLSLQSQLDSVEGRPEPANAGDQLPALAEALADHVVHPCLLREVLLSLDSRLRALEDTVTAPAGTGVAGTDNSAGGGD